MFVPEVGQPSKFCAHSITEGHLWCRNCALLLSAQLCTDNHMMQACHSHQNQRCDILCGALELKEIMIIWFGQVSK